MLFTLISLLFAFAASLAIGEAILRGFFPEFSYGYPQGLFLADEDLGFRFKPNYKNGFLTKQEFSTPIWTNSKGLRDRERDYAKEEGTFRILSVGDSFTWGAYGVAAEETFSAVLEVMLNDKVPERDFEVVNTGVFGWGTDNELAFYKRDGIQYDHDLVIVNLFVGNDFYDNMEWGEVSVMDGNLVQTRNNPTSVYSIKNLRAVVLRNSYLATFVERSLFSISAVRRMIAELTIGGESQHVYGDTLLHALVGKSEGTAFSTMFAKTEKLLVEFHDEVKKRGKEFALVVIPAIHQVDEDAKRTIYRKYDADAESIVKAQAALKALGAWDGFTVIDLLPEFAHETADGRSVYWKFNPHFNHHGNVVVARTIMSRLLEIGLINPRPGD